MGQRTSSGGDAVDGATGHAGCGVPRQQGTREASLQAWRCAPVCTAGSAALSHVPRAVSSLPYLPCWGSMASSVCKTDPNPALKISRVLPEPGLRDSGCFKPITC